MFPSAGATVYYNDAGEPTGWDNPSYDDPPEHDPYEYGYDYSYDAEDDDAEDAES
jgi:hypothetical protein